MKASKGAFDIIFFVIIRDSGTTIAFSSSSIVSRTLRPHPTSGNSSISSCAKRSI